MPSNELHGFIIVLVMDALAKKRRDDDDDEIMLSFYLLYIYWVVQGSPDKKYLGIHQGCPERSVLKKYSMDM